MPHRRLNHPFSQRALTVAGRDEPRPWGFLTKSLTLLAAGLLSTSAAATSPAGTSAVGDRIDNFLLLDHRGEARELYYQQDAEAVIIVAHRLECAALGDDLATLATLAADHPELRVWLLNPIDPAKVLGASGIETPILEDRAQAISRAFGFRQAGEAIVLDTGNWTLRYRGSVSGAVAAALTSGEAGAATLPASVGAAGHCPLPLAPLGEPADYADTIAPLLKSHCAYCHVEGGIGPWAMNGYDMVRGFAPMIREVLRTRRMPPWHADPHIGEWQGDRALTPEEEATLLAWLDAGAPRGTGADPLATLEPVASAWPLGEPDLVIDIPDYEVPASGIVDYQFPYVKNQLDHGVWIRAATVLPGDRRVVHHVLAGSVEGDTPPGRGDSVMDNYIIGYAPGAESYVMPEGTGVYLAPGGHFTFQMHYTPIGKAVVDNSRLGLYLSEEAPANFLRHAVVISPDLNIPPNTAAHEEAAYYEFRDDVIIHTLFPHAHYRGRSSSFEVRYPDGREETVLSVPNYDFNWQRGYNPVAPLRLPAGSRLIHRTVYDNSALNPANPNPDQTVHWGLQSFEEMLYGSFSYSWAGESTAEPTHDRTLGQATQLVGFLDKNMDGKVGWRELPREMKKRLVQGFRAVDTDGDGGLDIDEFLALMSYMEKAREQGEAPTDPSLGD